MKPRGQSLVEVLVALPVALLISAGLAQALWLLLVQQVLQAATVQVVRVGALNGMNMITMHEVLSRRMHPVTGRARYILRIERLAPSDEVVREHGELVEQGNKRFYELRSDFAGVRMESYALQEKEAWLQHRIGLVRVTWCQPLLVPLAAQAIDGVLRQSKHPAQRYCNQQSGGRPLLAIEARGVAQLVAPLRVAG